MHVDMDFFRKLIRLIECFKPDHLIFESKLNVILEQLVHIELLSSFSKYI
jgi:hypothetical protein